MLPKFISFSRHYPAISRSISSYTTERQLIGATHDVNNEPVGLFCIPELVQPEDFMRLARSKIELAQCIVNDIISTFYDSNPKKMLYTFDRLSSELCYLADPCNFLQSTHSESDVKRAAESASVAINSYVNTLNTNPTLYRTLKQCVDRFSHLWSKEEQRVAILLLKDFEISGVHLNEEMRNTVLQLQSREMKLGMEFFSQSLSPAHVGQWVMEDGHFMSLYSHIRKTVYTAYNKLDQDRASSLLQLINTRHKLARMLGYQSAADRIISNSMVGDINTVGILLHESAKLLRPLALEQVSTAREITISLLGTSDDMKTPACAQDGRMRVYDGAFYVNYARNNIWKTQTDSIDPNSSLNATLAEYFPLKNCLEAVNIICQSLFKVSFEPLSVRQNETWHSSVIKAGLIDREGLQGVLYLDLMNRASKPDIECQQLIQGSRRDENGRFQIPVAALSCNFSFPSKNASQLLSPLHLSSFFHEMGHALHSLLGRTSFQHVAGTRCPTDLGEIPSNLMEYFPADRRFLKLFAKHHKTEEVIPDYLLELLVRRGKQFEAYSTHIPVVYAIMDLMLHKREFKNEDEMLELEKEVYNIYGLYLPEDNTSSMLRFSHLSNYGSRYYSYTWAKAFASLFWQRKFANNPLSPLVGEQYRDVFLSRGYGTEPWDMVEAFLGFKPTTTDLVASVLCSVKEDSIGEEENDFSNQEYELKWQI